MVERLVPDTFFPKKSSIYRDQNFMFLYSLFSLYFQALDYNKEYFSSFIKWFKRDKCESST